MSEIRHGDTVKSKFFKGTGVVVGTSTVISDKKVVPGEEPKTQTLWEVRAPEEEFRLRIREQELEKV
jgi:hypothetical protein|tara:strand:+ start:300 stop:500 length:201 start_codon:yes stop_codon:yes gene_type:complete